MEERDNGVVLRTRPLTETSLIVHWLTEQSGRIATVAKGARRPSSPFRGKLDLCHVARIAFHRSRRGDLHTLREVVLVDTFPALRTSFESLRTAACAARILERFLESDTPVNSIYPLFLNLLKLAAAHPESPLPLLWFEWHLLSDQGMAPELEQATLSPGSRAVLRQIHAASNPLPPLRLSAPQERELRSFMNELWEASQGWVPGGLGR